MGSLGRLGLILALAAASCQTVPDGDGEGSGAAGGGPADSFWDVLGDSVREGSPQALALLGFLNGPDATLEALDVDAGLRRQAARSIVGHVRGADGAPGTADDDPLDSLAELDALAYVGPVTIEQLFVYVESLGLMPPEGAVAVEGVVLTQEQAQAIVLVANRASADQLDVDAGLDSRAAANIVAARPIADLLELAAIPYVGQRAIERLRDYASRWVPPEPEQEARPVEREILSGAEDWSEGQGRFVVFGACRHVIVDPTTAPNGEPQDPSVGDWAIHVYADGEELRMSIDGESEGWTLMTENRIALTAGSGSWPVYDPAVTYSVTYWTFDPE